MELLRLRRRTALAKKGHKLLKDKLDGLIQRLLEVVKAHRHLSGIMEEKLVDAFRNLILSSARTDPQTLYAAALLSPFSSKVDIALRNVMGVKIPIYELKLEGNPVPYGFPSVPAEMDQALAQFKGLLKQLVKLAEHNKTILIIASQIIEIKRRVNALEYILIPELEGAVRFIRMKLAEMERSTTVSLLKIKDIVRAR